MTPTQRRMIEKLRKDAETYVSFMEIKRFDIEETCSSFVSVFVEIGMIGDEDNPISRLFNREHTLVFIGKRGRMKVPYSRELKNGKWIHGYKPYKSFYSACRTYNA